MKEALSRDKLNFLHEALDRQLESVEAGVLATSAYSNRSKDRQRQDSKPSATNNTSNHSELEQLQKKLSYLEKKMEGIKLDEEDISSHSLISQSEVAEYRPATQKAKVHFDKPSSTSKQRDDGDYPLKSVGKSSPPVKQAERKQSSRKQHQTGSQTEETPLKRKYEFKEPAVNSIHNSAGKKASEKVSEKKLHSELQQLEKEIRKAESNLNLSRKSISQHSVKSLGRRNLSLQKSAGGTRQPHCQKSNRIELLQKELAKCKQQNRKLRSRVKVLQLTEVEFAKLKISFEKSEHIRKQQKLLLEGYKQKLQRKG